MFERTYSGYGGTPKLDERSAFIDRAVHAEQDGLCSDRGRGFSNRADMAAAIWDDHVRTGRPLPY